MKVSLLKRVLHHLINPHACSGTVYDPERKKVLLCVLTAGHEGVRHMAYSGSGVVMGDPEEEEDRPEEAPSNPADPDVLRLSLATPFSVPIEWCRRRGYRACSGYGGLCLQRDDEPVFIASVGDTLRWDGQKIVVNESPE